MLLLSGCAETQFLIHTAKRVSRAETPPPGEGAYKVGNPYQIDGIWYHPEENYEYDETGIASWYGHDFQVGHEWVVYVNGSGCRFRKLGG